MADPKHTKSQILSAILTTTEADIIPLTRAGVSSGSKLFGAAILSGGPLRPYTVATNNEKVSPLLHGEINCIQQFFAVPSQGDPSMNLGPRPSPQDCIFFATHEPCSLCLSGITWAGFKEFYFLFTYEDSRDLFSIPYDIDILEQVFRVRAPGDTDETLKERPLYNKRNKFFTAMSLAELAGEVEDESERSMFTAQIDKVKGMYSALSDTYQEGKKAGTESASIWK